MIAFRTRFIYPIFFLFLLFSIFWGLVLCLMVFKLPNYMLHQKDSMDLPVLFGAVLLFAYFFIATGHSTLVLRYGLNITNDKIELIDHLLFKRENIAGILKGYSKSQFGQFQNSYNIIILYLTDGRKINLTKYMYLNYTEIETNLNLSGIKFLGVEKFQWRNIIQRKYFYD